MHEWLELGQIILVAGKRGALIDKRVTRWHWELSVTDGISCKEKWSKRILKVNFSPFSMLQMVGPLT